MTNDLIKRVNEHKSKLNPKSFTARYDLNKLIYFELCENSMSAIIREKQIKDMNRSEKLEMIKKANPSFDDLYDSII